MEKQRCVFSGKERRIDNFLKNFIYKIYHKIITIESLSGKKVYKKRYFIKK